MLTYLNLKNDLQVDYHFKKKKVWLKVIMNRISYQSSDQWTTSYFLISKSI